MQSKIEAIKINLKKLMKNLPNMDKIESKRIVSLSSELLKLLLNGEEQFSLISRTIRELYNLTVSSKTFFVGGTFELKIKQNLTVLNGVFFIFF